MNEKIEVHLIKAGALAGGVIKITSFRIWKKEGYLGSDLAIVSASLWKNVPFSALGRLSSKL